MGRFLFLMAILVVPFPSSALGDDPAKPAEANGKQDELSPEAQAVAGELKASLPKDSEARAMLDDILNGRELGPGAGWFRLAVSQTRFGWPAAKSTYDANGDGRVTRKEFRGTRADFSRLDRNEDRVLTAADFDWSEHSLTRTPGFQMFFRADKDANGKITADEFQTLFLSLDGGSQGYLSLDDLRDQFQPPTQNPNRAARPRRSDRPSRSTLVLALQKQEIGSLKPGPTLNEPAPDFTLSSLSGEEVTLSKEMGSKPIVLIFGNFTCGPFRSQSGNLEKLYQRYRNRAKFFLVYVREAHPADGWWMNSNERVGIKFPQPQTTDKRRQVAQTCQRHLDLKIPFLVDTIEDSVGSSYSGMPNRLYVIDQHGRIAFKNGRGPFGFHPRELEQALIQLLNQDKATERQAD